MECHRGRAAEGGHKVRRHHVVALDAERKHGLRGNHGHNVDSSRLGFGHVNNLARVFERVDGHAINVLNGFLRELLSGASGTGRLNGEVVHAVALERGGVRRKVDDFGDAIHKATAMIARNYSVVCIEDLHVAGMVKNRHLAKSIMDAAFGEFRRQLEYKTARSGAALHVVDRWYRSSKTCSGCGVVKAKLSLSERVFNCGACGASMDRDLNAAINICVAGSAPETLNARGEDVRRADLVSGNADLGEARTKRSPTGGVRLGAGLGNEAMQPRIS